ncbi:hypothetical protein pb186bvf_001129 [Paramecium bursaria]
MFFQEYQEIILKIQNILHIYILQVECMMEFQYLQFNICN